VITIHKYPLFAYRPNVEMPKNAVIIKVGIQNGILHLWAVVDTDEEKETREFIVYGTGWELEDGVQDYLGTVFDGDGYVWHLFEKISDAPIPSEV